jgi:hypothetical protein
MTDYTVEISQIRQAIATGAKVVTYDGGRRVEYDSFESMKARIRYLEDLQAGASGARLSSCSFASFDRGDR